MSRCANVVLRGDVYDTLVIMKREIAPGKPESFSGVIRRIIEEREKLKPRCNVVTCKYNFDGKCNNDTLVIVDNGCVVSMVRQ